MKRLNRSGSQIETVFLGVLGIMSLALHAQDPFPTAITAPATTVPGVKVLTPPKPAPDNQNQQQNQQNPLSSLLSQMAKGSPNSESNSAAGTGTGNKNVQSVNAGACGSGSASANSPNAGNCDPIPDNVKNDALKQAVAFRSSCAAAQQNADGKIVINDYSDAPARTPMMYIFDKTGSKCLLKTAVTYGTGGSEPSYSQQAQPCSGGSENYTPPGFHLTAPHAAGKPGSPYNSSNSLALVALEGQDSLQRGILIHMAEAPGSCSSLGCSGISSTDFPYVKCMLGSGSLVYNYFGQQPLAPHCSSNAGFGNSHDGKICKKDPGAPSTPSERGTSTTY